MSAVPVQALFAVPHAMRPGLRRLAEAAGTLPGETGAVLRAVDYADPERSARRLAVKRRRLDRPEQDALLAAPGLDEQATVAALEAAVAAIGPTARLTPDPEDLRRLQAATPSPALRALGALSLSLQEDLALMRAEAGGGLVAEALAVAMPSGWAPREKVGRDFAAIHAPVADGEALRAAAPALGRAMLDTGPLLRFVWTLACSDALARHPGAPAAPPVDRVEGLWLRWERQVTLPLRGHGRALFLIGVHAMPLPQALPDAASRRALVDALATMSEAVVRYKGIAAERDLVLRAWGG